MRIIACLPLFINDLPRLPVRLQAGAGGHEAGVPLKEHQPRRFRFTYDGWTFLSFVTRIELFIFLFTPIAIERNTRK